MFINGLEEPLHGLVKYTKPITLHDAIERARDLQDALPKAKATFQSKAPHLSKGKGEKAAPSKESSFNKPLDIDLRRELRKKKLCFTCQDSWAPGHRCAAGKAHYIEVLSYFEEEDGDDEPRRGRSVDNEEEDPTSSRDGDGDFAPMSGTLASLRGVPKYLTLRVQGSVMNQRVSVLIDSGATHNFIDAHLVQRRAIPIDTFERFFVLVLGDRTMQCMQYVPSLSVTMGSYTLVDHFFVVDIPDTNIILGVQWLITLGKVTTDWKDL